MRTTLAAFLLLALAAGCSGTAPEETTAPPAADAGADADAAKAAPAFSMASLDGETHTLSGHAGKVVVLAFWDTH